MMRGLSEKQIRYAERCAAHYIGAPNAVLWYANSTDSWVLSANLPDMVPPLQRLSVKWSGDAIIQMGVDAILFQIDRLAERFGREREARRWAAVDP